MDVTRALRFLYRMLGAPNRTPGTAVTLQTEQGPVDADVYRPSGRPWATVLCLHGLALRGHRDPRLMGIGQALAATGVLAIAPQIEAMAQLRLHPLASDTITASMRAVRDSPEFGSPASIGVFGPSFAGGQALTTAAQPDLREHVAGMLLIGAYADARALLSHVLVDATADPYGRLILIRHFLQEIGELTSGIAEAIDTALADMGLYRDPELPAVLERIAPADRDRFLQVRDHEEVRAELGSEILANHAEAVDELSVTPHIPKVRAPVTLLHGAHDPVIPPAESKRIQALLAEGGQRAPMVTTRLLDHGNVMAGGAALLEVPTVVSAFVRWFRDVEEAGRLVIGVYDSGFGGLSVLRQLRRGLPERSFVYLGDSGRGPYGGRDVHTVLDFAEQAMERLFEEGCRLIVVACHTVSCVALRHLQHRYAGPGQNRRVLGVAIPGAEVAVQTSAGHIGILATPRTVSSGTYLEEIRKLGDHRVTQRAAPLLAPIVEEGWENTDIARLTLERYLAALEGVDTILLGCTHYPFLHPLIETLVPPEVAVLDPAPFVARALQQWLVRHPGFDEVAPAPRLRVLCTGDPDAFAHHGARFLGEPLPPVEHIAEIGGRLAHAHPGHAPKGQVVR